MALDDTCSKDSLTICKIFKTMLFLLLQHVHPSAGVWLSSWAANPLVHFTWVWEPVPQTFSDARSWDEPIPWCCVKRCLFWLNTAQDLQPVEFSEDAFLETDGSAFAHGFVWNRGTPKLDGLSSIFIKITILRHPQFSDILNIQRASRVLCFQTESLVGSLVPWLSQQLIWSWM